MAKRRLSRAEKGALGKITTMRAHWTYTDKDTGHVDNSGRNAELIGKRGVTCKNPQWDGKKPQFDKEQYWWVPASECRKCPFYAKRNEKFTFPRCTWRAKATTIAGAQIEVMRARAEILSNALKVFGIND